MVVGQPAIRPADLPQAILPGRLIRGRYLHPGQKAPGHAIEQIPLVGDMVVERHRLDAELRTEPPHRERIDTFAIGELDCGIQDAFACQRHSLGLSVHEGQTSLS